MKYFNFKIKIKPFQSIKYYNLRLEHKYKTEEQNRIRDFMIEEKRKRRIEAHKKRYSNTWKIIEAKIAIHAGSAKKFSRKTVPFIKTYKMNTQVTLEPPPEQKPETFLLSISNLKSTLNMIIDQEKNRLKYSTRESMLNKEMTINYVISEIINKFDEDLSENESVMEEMCSKVGQFFKKMMHQQIRVGINFYISNSNEVCTSKNYLKIVFPSIISHF